MKKILKYSIWIAAVFTFSSSLSCVKTNDFNIPKETCVDTITTTKTIAELFNIATETATKYAVDDAIEGYVISSDQEGNFFKNTAIQTSDGSLGFSVSIDQTDLYTIYNPGRKVYVKLNGLYLEKDNNVLEIGGLFIDNFQNETVGRIGYPAFEKVLIKSCEVIDENSLVNSISINDVSDAYLNTLVEFSNVQFIDDALGTTLYDSTNDVGNATNHLIQDVSGALLIFRTSAFADFASIEVPNGNGSIRGVLTKFGGDYQLLARTYSDVNLNNERKEIVLKNNLYFTELADPNNNADARFIEIYNGEIEPVNLNGWTIRRYTNNNTTVSSTLDLSGNTIDSNQAFVIAVNASTFETVFGFPPDLEAGTNGPADSNGDDNLELVDSEGTVVDVFGIIGEDGSNTNHEFEDGRALRNFSITQGNPIYTFNEWHIWNDTGDAGTTNSPQDAPGFFSPGIK
mgnify:CR=1 FL=1|tara:strand:+ start:252994 stop:254364 length:1371 start_codon:yes stop_codon:yes gene_type:complete